MDWDLEIKRLIHDSFDGDGKRLWANSRVRDNRLFLTVSDWSTDKSKTVEVILKPVEDGE